MDYLFKNEKKFSYNTFKAGFAEKCAPIYDKFGKKEGLQAISKESLLYEELRKDIDVCLGECLALSPAYDVGVQEGFTAYDYSNFLIRVWQSLPSSPAETDTSDMAKLFHLLSVCLPGVTHDKKWIWNSKAGYRVKFYFFQACCQQIAQGVFYSVDHLEECLVQAIDTYNKTDFGIEHPCAVDNMTNVLNSTVRGAWVAKKSLYQFNTPVPKPTVDIGDFPVAVYKQWMAYYSYLVYKWQTHAKRGGASKSQNKERKRQHFSKINDENWDWLNNFKRTGGGFWHNARWCEAQIERKKPLVNTMIEEMVFALPPCTGVKIADYGCGSGHVSKALLDAYPDVSSLSLIDESQDRLDIAESRNVNVFKECHYVCEEIQFFDGDNGLTLPGAPFDIIVAGFSISNTVAPVNGTYQAKRRPEDATGTDGGVASSDATVAVDDESNLSVAEKYDRVFEVMFRSLSPGGHFIIGDHNENLRLFDQMNALAGAGFTAVDCSWRENDTFVYGGRRPNIRF
eukprot:Awhi_evm1s2201